MKHQGVGAHESGTKWEEAHWTHLVLLGNLMGVFYLVLYLVFCHVCMGLLSQGSLGSKSMSPNKRQEGRRMRDHLGY